MNTWGHGSIEPMDEDGQQDRIVSRNTNVISELLGPQVALFILNDGIARQPLLQCTC